MQTKVIEYDNEKRMKRGIESMGRHGWRVVNSQVVPARYGCLKTGGLGCMFLPLALLGKGRDRYQVTFQK